MIKGIEILWKEVGKDLEQGQLSTITTVRSQRKIPEAFPTKKTDWVKPPPAAQVGMALHNPVSHHTVPPWPPCFYRWPATVSISTELPSCQAASNYIILMLLNERALPNIKHFLTPLLSQTEREATCTCFGTNTSDVLHHPTDSMEKWAYLFRALV